MARAADKKYISLREASERIPYSQDYLRLLIRLGYLQGVKLGRNWFTTEEWVDEYCRRYSRKMGANVNAAPVARAVLRSGAYVRQLFRIASRIVCARVSRLNERVSFFWRMAGAPIFAPLRRRGSVLAKIAIFAVVAIGVIGAFAAHDRVAEGVRGMRASVISAEQGVSNFLLTAEVPSPKQFIAAFRADLRDIFTKSAAPAPEAVIVALKTIFDRSFAFRPPAFSLSPLLQFFGLAEPSPVGVTPPASAPAPAETPAPAHAATTTPSIAAVPAPAAPAIREVITRKEIVAPADVSSFQTKLDALNSYILTQFSRVNTSLADLGVQLDSKTSFTTFARSEKIDQLIAPSILSGLTLSGDLSSTGSFTFSGSGRVSGGLTVDGALSSGALSAGNASFGGLLTVSGAGTSTFTGGVSAAGLASSNGLRVSAGDTTLAGGLVVNGGLSVTGTGTTTISGPLTVQGTTLTVAATSTITSQFAVTGTPVASHTFAAWSTGVAGSGVSGASVYINPASAVGDANLLGIAVAGSPRFLVDAEGDVFANTVTLQGGASLATTTISGNLTIEGDTVLGDAPNSDTALIHGATTIFASTTGSALTVWNSTADGDLLRLQDGATLPTTDFRVSAGGQAAIGTTTFSGLSQLTIGATTTAAIPLTLKGVTGQTANLFRILNSADTGLFTVDNVGNVGIGTTSPFATLSVNAAAGAASFIIGSSTATNFIVDPKGNVGIGMAHPGVPLDVQSAKTGADVIRAISSSGNTIFEVTDDSNHDGSIKISSSDAQRTIYLTTVPGVASYFNNANVGIGTTSPNNLLAVAGNASFGSGSIATAGVVRLPNNTAIEFRNGQDTDNVSALSVSGSNDITLGTGAGVASIYLVPGPAANIYVTTSPGNGIIPTADNQFVLGGGTNRWKSISVGTGDSTFAGSVGIGTTSPYSLLSISNSASTAANTPLFSVASTTAGTATSTLMTVLANGNMGIGTTSPTAKLAIQGISGETFNLLDILPTSGSRLTVSANGGVEISGKTGASFGVDGVGDTRITVGDNTQRWSLATGWATAGAGTLSILEENVASRLTIDTSGNVGIGTTNPGAKLDVNGIIDITGLTLAAVGNVGGGISINLGSGFNAIAPAAPFLPAVDNSYDIGSASLRFRSAYFSQGATFATVSGNVGIGTNSPTTPLYISAGSPQLQITNPALAATTFIQMVMDGSSNGFVNVQNGPAYFGTLSSNQPLYLRTASTIRLAIDGSGNVGIGTTTPVNKLVVAGTTETNLRLDIDGTGSSGTGNAGLRILKKTGASNATIDFDTGATQDWVLGTGITATDNNFRLYGNAAAVMTVENSGATANTLYLKQGNVGIGTTSPWGLLSVNPNGISSTAMFAIGSSTATQFVVSNQNGSYGNVGIGTANPAKLLTLSGTSPTLRFVDTGGSGRTWDLQPNGNIWQFQDVTAGQTRMVIDNTGNVGIGTTTVQSMLDIGGTNVTALEAYSTTGATVFSITRDSAEGILNLFDRVSTPNQGVKLDPRPGASSYILSNVGIGTTTPFEPLSVSQPSDVDGADIAIFTSPNGQTVRIFGGSNNTLPNSAKAILKVMQSNSTTRSINAAGSINANGTDYAEYFIQETQGSLEKGDIVSLSTANGKVKKAAIGEPLIGTISERPAFVGGDRFFDEKQPEDSALVGLVGQIPTKVSLENGPIKIGDRIAVSSLPGVGMKATISGETVGIALEPFDGSSATTTGALPDGTTVSTGKILVFVNLGYAKLDDVVTELGTKSAALGTGSTSPSPSNLAPSSVNAWSVSQTSGKVNVNFFGDVSLNGNAIINVSKIIGMWGKWTIDENGVITAAKVIADEVSAQSLEVGSAPKPNGITLYDPDGLAYCVKVQKGGALRSEAGVCGTSAKNESVMNISTSESTMTTAATNSTMTTPTTNPAAADNTATTTNNLSLAADNMATTTNSQQPITNNPQSTIDGTTTATSTTP